MTKIFRKLYINLPALVFFLVAILLMISSGCTTAPTSTTAPAPDLDAVRTESAKTVVADITVQAALNPSAVPTDEPAPPATEIPILEPTATAAQASLAQENTATSQPTAKVVPTTKPPANNSSSVEQPTPAYRCDLIRQAPANGYNITPGGNFDVTWAVRNTGTVTWESQTFDFIYLKGDEFHKFADGQDLNDDISENEIHDFFLNMVAPSTPGFYQTWWSLVDGHQTPVCILYISINVVE